MLRKVVALLALLTAPGAAQTDPVSGLWTGEMAPWDAPRAHPIRVEMKLAAGAITGSVTGPPQPGEIKGGSFDPKTGALKLEIDVKGEGSVNRVVLEGTMIRGVATGRVTGGGISGGFQMVKQPARADGAATTKEVFHELSGWVTKAAEMAPADRYTYRPAPAVRTFGQLIAHIADSYIFFCARAVGRNVEWSSAVEKGSTDKAAITAKLREATASCQAAYDGGGDAGELIRNLGHSSLHYGNAVTYLCMLGLTPPSN
jgi:hypothetical protein